jgi:hypothetical protein
VSPAVNHKRHAPPTFGLSKLQNGASEPGDELQGDYTREQLMRMNARFCDRLERAIASGKERPKDEPRTS